MTVRSFTATLGTRLSGQAERAALAPYRPATAPKLERFHKNAMPFVPVPNTLMAEIRYLFDGEQAENTLYFEFGSTPGIADAEALADALFTWWDTNVKPIQSSAAALREIFVTDLSSQNSFTHARVTSPPSPGQAAGQGLPNNVTTVISLRTHQRGRSFRGRNYWVGLTESQVDVNTVSGTVLANIQAAYVAIQNAIQGLGAQWVVVSRFSNGQPRTTGVTTPITSVATVDNTVDSQRRRLPGRGQ